MLEKLHDSLQRIVLDKVFGKLKGMVKGEILKVLYLCLFECMGCILIIDYLVFNGSA